MIGFFNRLDDYFKSKGIKPGAVDTACGLGNGSFAKAMKRGSMTTDMLFKIVEHYGLNMHFLHTGIGSPESIIANEEDLDKLRPLEIVNYIQDNLEKFMQLKRFQVLIEGVSTKNENEAMKEMFNEMKSQIDRINKQAGIK